MMTLWTGFKQLHSASDETIGPNEEEEEPHVMIQSQVPYKRYVNDAVISACADNSISSIIYIFATLL